MSTKDYYAPIRPPRGAKVSKDTSGRLMNIIAELSISKSNDDRKRKMDQLKKDFEASDSRLVKLIAAHREQLSITMESFSKISAKINTSRRGCHEVKDKLSACKKLLECKRDEIRRLWSESLEHREVISMLKEINDLSKVHHNVEDHLKHGNFAAATELVVSSIGLFKGKLSAVDALKDLKSEVYALRETLHAVLMQELHKALYMCPDSVFLTKIDDGKTYEDIFTSRKSQGAKLPVVGESYDLKKDSNYERISVIINCVTALNRLPETVEILKDGCSRQLMSIVKNSSQVMYHALEHSSLSCISQSFPIHSLTAENSEEEHSLFHLFDAILEQYRCVAINHQSFLDNLQRVMMTHNLTEISYELADTLSKIQASVECFVSDYLDLQNSIYATANTHTQRAAATFTKVPTVSDISSFFLRKNVTRPKKHALFKFDGSSHAINMKSYLEEEKDSVKEKKNDSTEGVDQPVLICQPTTKNIIIIYKSLKNFISEIELSLQIEESGTHCPLHTFLMDCVKIFLDQTNLEINKLMEKISHSLEMWKTVSNIDESKAAGTKSEILKSTYILNTKLKEIERLIYALPDYSNHFIQLICYILQMYKDLCNAAYKGLIYPDFSEEQRVFSLSWARDKDISRLLRSLPNWTNLKYQNETEDNHAFEESPEEIRFRNKEESELLIRNLSCGKDSISPCEIISDHTKLRNLALMHESMEWLSSNILTFAESLPENIQMSIPSSVNEKFNDENDGNIEYTYANGMNCSECLKKLSKEFEDLADTCLLVLHLEVRAHSFYYLLPLSKQGSYVNRKDDQEPEPEVVRLNTDLAKIDEATAPILQPKKIKYIFEGLGELLSTVLINSVSNIKKINENGVKKMGRNIFAIQQSLAGITMTREVALDRARQYFDLLNRTFEEILNQIVEEGPQFQEHEYSAVIQLLHNSREGIHDQEPVNTYLEKLRQILDEVAVSV